MAAVAPATALPSTRLAPAWPVTPSPAWQKGTGVPADSARDVPDLALYAAIAQNGSFYPECYQDGDCQPVSGGNTVQITAVGGTSASSPAFAGIMALVNQKYGPPGSGRLRSLSAGHAVSRSIPRRDRRIQLRPLLLSPTSPDCISITNPPTITDPTYGPAIEGQIGTGTTPEYNATAGYDLASGLGSVDANVLVADWNKVTFATSNTTLTPSETTFTHGTPITISGTVTPSTATGDVALMTDSTEPVQQGQPWFTLKNGSYSSNSVNFLPGGTYNIWGQYSGDGTNAASKSTPVSITVTPEASTTYFNVLDVATGQGQGLPPLGTSIPYGTQLILAAQPYPTTFYNQCIASSSPPSSCNTATYTFPTGTVAFADNGTTINTAVVNAEGDAEYNAPWAIGSHSVTAGYSGDASYNKSSASAITFSIAKDTPTINAYTTITTTTGAFVGGQSIRLYHPGAEQRQSGQ